MSKAGCVVGGAREEITVPIKTIVAKNITGSPVSMADLGVTIAGAGQFSLSDFFRSEEIWSSDDLTAAINADQIRINDGVLDLTKPQSLSYVTPVAISSPVALSVLKQSVSADLAVNTTTTSLTFIDLLTANIAVGGAGFLLIWFTVAGSLLAVNQTAFFRITVDGVAQRGVAFRSPSAGQPAGASICLRVPVVSGARVVKAQWRVSGSTGQIRPVLQPDAESAELVVAEVSA